jgi:diguanylate cyclase (GGDEF)-like protein
MRVLSLVAGIALIVTGLATLIGRRHQVGADRDRRLETSADLVSTKLDATIARIAAVLAVATPDTPVGRLADALGLPVCAVGDERGCPSGTTRIVPFPAAAGQPGSVVLVVSNSQHVVVAADRDGRRLVVPAELDTATLPSGLTATLVPVAREPLLAARTSGGVRMYATPSTVEFIGGPWAVRTSTAAAVRLTDGERALVGDQVAIGALLALLALGGIWSEHRSLQHRAATDALTRLPNRPEFERRATETLARLARDHGAACLMVIDLDQFKIVNDTIGHDAGDRALVAAADRLRQAVRDTDLVGRWGGDEFVVLLPGIVDVRAVPERAATIANAIAAAPPIGSFELTASVGAALFPAHGTDLETLLRAADRAMYAAKVQGVPHHLAEGV